MSFDAYLYQTIEKKQQFISQIMTEKSPVRTVDDVDQSVLDYAEIKALCVGNPKIKEKMDLEQDLKKLNALQSQYKKNLYRMENAVIKTFPAQIKAKERNIENYSADERRLASGTAAVSEGISPMVIDGIPFQERVKAGEAIKAACQSVTASEGIKIGTYRGFELHLSFDSFNQSHVITARGDMPYPVKLEGNFSTQGVVTRIDNVLDKIPEYTVNEKESLQNTINQMETAKVEISKPFAYEDVIKEKAARVAQLNVELSLDAQKAQKAAEAETEGMDVDGGELKTDKNEMKEIGQPISDSHGAEVTQDIQANIVNSETIIENFEVAENGGQGAFVSGDIHIEKFTDKASSNLDAPYRQEKAIDGNINGASISNGGTKGTAAMQRQPEPKPVKPKRDYFDR